MDLRILQMSSLRMKQITLEILGRLIITKMRSLNLSRQDWCMLARLLTNSVWGTRLGNQSEIQSHYTVSPVTLAKHQELTSRRLQKKKIKVKIWTNSTCNKPKYCLKCWSRTLNSMCNRIKSKYLLTITSTSWRKTKPFW
jgi:hypothetical protein